MSRCEAVNAIALSKGQEVYIFLYGDDQRADAMRTAGRWASDSGLSFNWYDAANVSIRMREQAEQQKFLARERC